MDSVVLIAIFAIVGLFFFLMGVVFDVMNEARKKDDLYIKELLEKRREEDDRS